MKVKIICIMTCMFLIVTSLPVSGLMATSKTLNTIKPKEPEAPSLSLPANEYGVPVYNAETLFDDYECYLIDYDLYENYISLEDGDKFYFIDTIDIVSYNEEENYTHLVFNFLLDPYTMPHWYFKFEGDLTDEYSVDDRVRITLHIKHVDIDIPNPWYPYYGPPTFNLDIEMYEENWIDEDYFLENSDVWLYAIAPMSQDYVVHYGQ